MSQPGAPADEGSQPERTVLAWRRTALTAAGITALAARGWFDQPSEGMLLTLTLGALTTGVLCWGARVRMRSSRADPRHTPQVLSLVVLCATVTVSFVGVSVLMFPA